jgi:hypothetical protein
VQDRAQDCGDELIKTAFGFNGDESQLKLKDPGEHDVSAKRQQGCLIEFIKGIN